MNAYIYKREICHFILVLYCNFRPMVYFLCKGLCNIWSNVKATHALISVKHNFSLLMLIYDKSAKINLNFMHNLPLKFSKAYCKQC